MRVSGRPSSEILARRKRAVEMGDWLRTRRQQCGYSQADVAKALDRTYQYVSEIENGRRGSKMDPLLAVKWAEFLEFDAQVLFAYLGIDDASGHAASVRRYLETMVWGDRVVRAQHGVADAQKLVQMALELHRDGSHMAVVDQLRDLATRLSDCAALLGAKQTGRAAREKRRVRPVPTRKAVGM